MQPSSDNPTRHCQAASSYLQRGWYPIPVEPGGKKPIGRGWPNLRLTPTEAAATWDTANPPNIGLLTGEPSRLVVLDFDAAPVFLRWELDHPEAVNTYTVARTNAEPGRCHLYFILCEGQAAPASAKVPGWDLLSTGRQVVAPPSRHSSGGTYRVMRDVPALPWRDEYRPEVPPQNDGHELAWDAVIGAGTDAYAAAALAGEAQAVAGTIEGGRNERLNTAALKIGHLVGAGALPESEADAVLLAAARQCGLPEREAAATIASGLRKGQTEPHAVPPPFQRREGLRPILTTATPPSEAPEPWVTPSPLGAVALELPPWPWDTMPSALQAMGQDVAIAVGVHESLAAAGALGMASIALANRVELTIKPGHVCRANTYWLVAAGIGTGKTSVMRPFLPPLLDWEAGQLDAFRNRLARWQAAQLVIDGRRAAMKREAGKPDTDMRELEARLARLELEVGEEPEEPRLFAEDATSEALGKRLAGNSERMGVVSSEARKVLQLARGRYNEKGGDLDLWLKAHAGDPHRVDRQGRPPYDLRSPCLSALLFTQPDALQAIGADPEARASGFLARFMYVVPPGGGATEYPTDSVPDRVARAYRNTVTGILNLSTAIDRDGNHGPLPATLAPEAYDLFRSSYGRWGRELNEVAQAGNVFLATWLGKCREHAARLALLFAVVESVSTGQAVPGLVVSLADMDAAIRLCDHLRIHAERAAGVIGETPEAAAAARAWEWIVQGGARLAGKREAEGCGAVVAVKARDLVQAGLPGCDSTEAASKVLGTLEERGYLQAVLWARPGASARPHELWFVNPKSTR